MDVTRYNAIAAGPPPPPTSFTAAGFEMNEFNGEYTEDGAHNGKTNYTNGEGFNLYWSNALALWCAGVKTDPDATPAKKQEITAATPIGAYVNGYNATGNGNVTAT